MTQYLRLRDLTHRLDAAAPNSIGFPAAVDGDFRPAAPLLGYLLNNLGDPYMDGRYPGHTKDFERDVLAFAANLFRAPTRWSGYVTSGGSEGNLYGLYLARTRHPTGVVAYSKAAHYSVAKAAHLLGMRTTVIDTTATGEIDYQHLRAVARYLNRPVIVVANVGTTMTEAIDDVTAIHTALDQAGVTDRYVHADAALTGIPLALTSGERPGFDLADGADSITVSGHKFLGTPLPCGIVIAHRRHTDRLATMVSYIGSVDTTITGSRSGLAAVMLWMAIHHHGTHGLRQRAEHGRDLAAYTHDRLTQLGWPAWRNPHALTVMLRTPPTEIAARWPLATADGWSHIICMPGITRHQIDAFIADLQAWLAAVTSQPVAALTGRPQHP
jgi:histidine decarboxylase